MEPFAEPEHRKQAIMDRGQVAYEIKQPIPAGGYLFLELLVGERSEVLIKTSDDELPRIESGNAEQFFVCHVDLTFMCTANPAIRFGPQRQDAKSTAERNPTEDGQRGLEMT